MKKSEHSNQMDLSTSQNIPYPSEPRHAGQLWTSYHSDVHAVKDWGPSLTKQSEADACDINKIIERHGLPEPIPGIFGDFSDQASFLEAQDIIAFAKTQFMALPAKVRARFNNDPAEMLAFVDNPENADEMVRLGLATRNEVAKKDEGGQPAPEIKKQVASSAVSSKKDAKTES